MRVDLPLAYYILPRGPDPVARTPGQLEVQLDLEQSRCAVW